MFLEVFILALALSMDAFAVSVGLGSKLSQNRRAFATKAALLFGFFQAFMPLIGFLAGIGLESFIKEFDHWIAFTLLVFIGAK
ncbi:MAG TPA: manganese efflux pump MntP, partial [Sulfurospirillum sp. UBA11407]